MEEINLESRTLEALRSIAKLLKIKGISKYKKDELIKRIEEEKQKIKEEYQEK